jgi:taurine dioxygenase
MLNYLYQHAENLLFQRRFRWTENAIALWDNRCAQHNPVNDYHGHRRLMHRITLAGERPA